MKGAVAVFTMFLGMATLGFSMRTTPQAAAVPNAIDVDYDSGQAALGIALVIAGLATLKQSQR